jgi:hypothetical protein
MPRRLALLDFLLLGVWVITPASDTDVAIKPWRVGLARRVGAVPIYRHCAQPHSRAETRFPASGFSSTRKLKGRARRDIVGPMVRRRPKPDRRRALEFLAASHDGATEAIMRAHGFTVAQMVELGHARPRRRRSRKAGGESKPRR